jgi:apolipoprotein N-acyltransferase
VKRIQRILAKLYLFIVPNDITLRSRRLELMVWAFLLSLSFYPGSFGVLAWVSLARPIYILSKLKGRVAYNAAYFFGMFFSLFCLYWVWMVTPPGMIATIIILGFYVATTLALFVRAVHIKPIYGFVLFPFLWVGLEYFRTLSEFAFPWSDLGYSQAHFLYILQIVSVISVHGLSLLIVTVNVLLAQLCRREVTIEKKMTAIFASCGIVAAVVAYGWIVTPPYPIPGDYKVALLQGSIPIDQKWEPGNELHSFYLYDTLAQSVADSNVNLYVWPETAAPCYIRHEPHCRDLLKNTVVSSKAPHLIGALEARHIDNKLRYFNSCFYFDTTGEIVGSHDKVKLVPFAEHVPYQDHFAFLERDFLRKYLTFIDQTGIQWWSDFYPGDSARLFDIGDIKYGVLICFESTFPEYVRALIRNGASFVVGMTNDTWWGHAVALDMHSRMFITRAVENRCWMARSANSGYTYVVDDYGRIRNELPLDAVQALVVNLGLLEEYSIFTRYGDIVGKVSFLITLSLAGILTAVWLVNKRSSKS